MAATAQTEEDPELHDIFPSESIGGYLIRRGLIEGLDVGPTYSAIVCRSSAPSARYFGWRVIPRITSENSRSVKRFSKKAAEHIAKNHSIVPLFVPTGHPDVMKAMARLFEQAGKNREYYLSEALHKVRYRPTYTRMRHCSSCFREQIAQFGVAYYRREWTVPYIKNCAIHTEPLRGIGCEHCGDRDGIADILRNFEQRCRRCSADLWQSSSTSPTDAALRADNWFRDMLERPISRFKPEERDKCIEIVSAKLDGKSLDVDSSHRCDYECDVFSCTERLSWMLGSSGRVRGSSVDFHMRQNRSYMGVPAFLVFWLPIISAFRDVNHFHTIEYRRRVSCLLSTCCKETAIRSFTA